MNALSVGIIELASRGFLLLGAAFLISLALRRCSAAFVSCYWRTAIVAVLVLPAVPTVWTIRQSLDEAPIAVVVTEPSPAAAPPATPEAETVAVAEIAASKANADSGSRTPLPKPGAPAPTAQAEAPVAQVSIRGGWFAPTVLVVWLLGAVVVFGRWAAAALRFWRLCRQSDPVGDAELVDQNRQVAASIGLRRVPELRTHPDLAVPMAGGLLRARVLLPAECLQWSAEDRRMVLLHELVHVVRRDAMFHLFSSLTKALHWANPLAWIAVRSMRAAAEKATDDRVLEGGVVGPGYARLLVEFASKQMATRSPAAPAAASSMAQPATVESRVRRILDPEQRRSRPHRAVVAAVIGGFAVLLAGVGGSAIADGKGDAEKEPESADAGDRAAKGAIESKLTKIVVPVIDFEAATLEEAVDFLVRQSREQGHELNIIASPHLGEVPRPTLSLKLRDIRLRELLNYIGLLTHMQVDTEPHSIVFRAGGSQEIKTARYSVAAPNMERLKEMSASAGGAPADDDPFSSDPAEGIPSWNALAWLDAAGVLFPRGASAHYEELSSELIVRNTRGNLALVEAIVESMMLVRQHWVPQPDTRNPMRERLRAITIDVIDFQDASLAEAVDYLRMKSGEKPINLVVVPPDSQPDPVGQKPKPITMKLRNIPFESALKYITEFSNYSYRVDSNAVLLYPGFHGSDDYEKFEVRTLPVGSAKLTERLMAHSWSAREWMKSLGVDISEGCAAYFDPFGGNLIVRNSPEQITLIETTLASIRKAEGAGSVPEKEPEPKVEPGAEEGAPD